MNIEKKLIEKYETSLDYFDYIEYPHKSFWTHHFGDSDFRTSLKEAGQKNLPFILYIHIPFCKQPCWFCVCHREITNDYEKIKNYLYNSLFKEIDLLADFCKENFLKLNIQEIYIGGGCPTLLEQKEFDDLIQKIKLLVDPKKTRQFTVEIDPRQTSPEKLIYLHEKGVNKLSFGIQDFDPQVQKAINRVQPPELIKNLLTPEIRNYFKSINFDFICGLPKQTSLTVRQTAEIMMKLSPDRISWTYLHYNPSGFYSHQKFMEKETPLPDVYERKILFAEALKIFQDHGYVRVGFEHFVKPTDDVAKGVNNKTLYYNSLGATQGECVNVIGLGRHSYSTIGDYYFQKTYEQQIYESEIAKGRFPIFRGHKLDKDDKIRRDIIQNLKSYFRVDYKSLEKKYQIDFKKYFIKEIDFLQKMANDGLMQITDEYITTTDLGKEFINIICQQFDAYSSGVKKYAK